MEKYIVTINRQFGSLGRPIAKKMSEILDIEYYDRDIVEKVSKEMDLPVSLVSDEEESTGKFFKMQFPLGTGNGNAQNKIFEAQQNVIATLAGKGSCIIVGRCSDHILRNEPNLTRIFIYASEEMRLKNCVESLNMDPDEAKKMIRNVDKARDSYHMRYAKYLPGDFDHNDIMIDSSVLGTEGTAVFLADFIKSRLKG